MKKVVLIGFCLLATAAQAKVTFYKEWNCDTDGRYFHKSGGQIAHLEQIQYKYSCIREHSGGPGGNVDIPVRSTCRGDFDDGIYSVKITNNERVEIYEHPDFEGSSEYLGKGNGCYNLRHVQGYGSSIKIYQKR